METLDRCRQQVFRHLWQHYYQLVPFAPKIEKGLQERGDLWAQDHVAFRTLPGQYCGASILQGLFEILGYQRQDDYHFEEKRLNAFWMAPPDTKGEIQNASAKIFISELIPDQFSPAFRETLQRYTNQVLASPLEIAKELAEKVKQGDNDAADKLVALISRFLTSAPPWPRPSFTDFSCLQNESEYASWTLLYGNQINHFTVSVHLMKSFASIADLGKYIEQELKIPMNHSGGLVKGNSELRLEQIATMAVKVPFLFQDQIVEQSYGFVEFALRYPLEGRAADDQWQSYYQGFVTSNADKIFESTFR
ncbi:MAG: DUF1338 domain-containing protein [Oligoflexus sp.]